MIQRKVGDRTTVCGRELIYTLCSSCGEGMWMSVINGCSYCSDCHPSVDSPRRNPGRGNPHSSSPRSSRQYNDGLGENKY